LDQIESGEFVQCSFLSFFYAENLVSFSARPFDPVDASSGTFPCVVHFDRGEFGKKKSLGDKGGNDAVDVVG
jgi:hypothetical protein